MATRRPLAPGLALAAAALLAAAASSGSPSQQPTPAVAGRAAAGASPAVAGTAAAGSSAPAESMAGAVIARRIIGHSVRDHPIRAYLVGERDAETSVVAIASMHGNETDGGTILHALKDGRPVEGVKLWVVPRQNPDGALRDRRHNARGVDLNRNFPTRWKELTGWFYSGPRHSSEPETRAVKRFLTRVDPDYVVSFHSPLRGIDAYGAKDRRFARTLADRLRLPVKEFDCGGVCHGTLTQWFNKKFDGACVTVELASSHTWRYLHVRAPRGLVRAVGGHF